MSYGQIDALLKIASVFLFTFCIPLIPLPPFCDPVRPRHPTLLKLRFSLNENHLTQGRNSVNSVGFLQRRMGKV